MVFESWIANNWAFEFSKMIASPVLTQLMQLITDSVWVVLPILAIYLYLKKDKNIYSYVLGVVALYVIGDLLKMIFQEPRPCNVSSLSWINNVGCESSFSFPSDHATVLAGLPLFLVNYKVLNILYMLWMVLALFGRIYLGLHYLSDVVAGVILSLLVWYLVYTFRSVTNKIGQENLHIIKG